MSSEEREKKNDKKRKEKAKENGKEEMLKRERYQGPKFGFLERKIKESFLYSFTTGSNNNLQKYNGQYYYLIAIMISDDQNNNSKLLKATLDSIEKNISTLNKIGIDLKDILILLFFEEIKSNDLFISEDFNLNQKDKDYIYIELTTKNMLNEFNLIAFAKENESYIIENLEFFYTKIVKDLLKENNGFIYSTILKNGIDFKENSLSNLFPCLIGPELTKNSIAIPTIETKSKGLFANIQQYENIHFNLYDLNYYDISCSVPINSDFNIMKINKNLLNSLNEFYNNLNKNCSIYYHDYFMGIFLKNKLFNVNFIPFVSGYFYYDNIDYSDYMSLYIEKYSGYYSNFFNLFKSILGQLNLINKLFLLFQLIGMIIQFIYPSLSTLVIYSIFFECFNINDNRTAFFFTLIYVTFLFFAGVIFKRSSSISQMKLITFFFFIFFEFFYVFILICSIFAMNNIKKNKNLDKYKFNKIAISLLIIFNFIFGILPMFLSIGKILENIVNMIFYLFLGSPSSNSVFLMSYLFNASDKSGGIKLGDKNGFFLLVFFLSNIFFGSLIFFLTNRSKRVNCVLILSIIFTVYNFVKQISIIIRILVYEKYFSQSSNDKKVIEMVLNDIKKIKNIPVDNIINNNNNNNNIINNNNNNNIINNNNNNNNSVYDNKDDLMENSINNFEKDESSNKGIEKKEESQINEENSEAFRNSNKYESINMDF